MFAPSRQALGIPHPPFTAK
jgi:hypothetical protein